VRSVGPFRSVLVGFDGSPDGPDVETAGLRRQPEVIFGELAHSLRPDGPVRMSVQMVYSDHDSPGQVVTAYAEEHGFDILVLGRHGDGARRKSRLGRVADRPPRIARCPSCC
jgi:nucleotide-binding universal stress UspA family protein